MAGIPNNQQPETFLRPLDHYAGLLQVNRSKYTVKDTKNILSRDINKQLMIMVQKTHKVKERELAHICNGVLQI